MLRQIAVRETCERLQIHEIRMSARIERRQDREARGLVHQSVEVRKVFER
jgi:hypothetical protein